MKVDNKLISRLEDLALLSFTEEEKERLSEEFTKLIGMIDKLKDVDTDGVEALIHINDHVQRMREDIPGDMLDRSDALMNASKATDQFFSIPKVIQKK